MSYCNYITNYLSIINFIIPSIIITRISSGKLSI